MSDATDKPHSQKLYIDWLDRATEEEPTDGAAIMLDIDHDQNSMVIYAGADETGELFRPVPGEGADMWWTIARTLARALVKGREAARESVQRTYEERSTVMIGEEQTGDPMEAIAVRLEESEKLAKELASSQHASDPQHGAVWMFHSELARLARQARTIQSRRNAVS